jgi:hypothetical protein
MSETRSAIGILPTLPIGPNPHLYLHTSGKCVREVALYRVNPVH